jgi:CBS domain containing-hemolysin-like protein
MNIIKGIIIARAILVAITKGIVSEVHTHTNSTAIITRKAVFPMKVNLIPFFRCNSFSAIAFLAIVAFLCRHSSLVIPSNLASRSSSSTTRACFRSDYCFSFICSSFRCLSSLAGSSCLRLSCLSTNSFRLIPRERASDSSSAILFASL